MASTTPAPTTAASAVSQVAAHAVVETVTAVASQIQKNDSADLKDIVTNVSKEVAAAKTEDKATLIEKVEEGSKEIAKDVVEGVEEAGNEIEKHPELIAEGAVVAAVAAVGAVAPALAVGGVAVVGKMAADSAVKTIDSIAVESGSGVVKQIATDLAKDMSGDAATPAGTGAVATVDAKAAAVTNGVKPAGADTTSTKTAAASDVAPDGSKIVAVSATTAITPSEVKPVTTNVTQGIPKNANGNLVDEKKSLKETASVSGDAAQTTSGTAGAGPEIATTSTTDISPGTEKATTKASPEVPSTSTTGPPVVPNSADIGVPITQELPNILQLATTLPAIVPNESLALLHQKLDLIREALHQRETLNALHQKVDALTTSIQTLTHLLTAAGTPQSHSQVLAPAPAQITSLESPPSLTPATPPLSLITPPLPPTTHIETHQDASLLPAPGQNSTSVIVTSNSSTEASRPAAAVTDKRLGFYGFIGKLFYLRG